MYFVVGRKQNGDILGDVILPPWAKGDAQEFIRVHREVLEITLLFDFSLLSFLSIFSWPLGALCLLCD